MRTILAVSILLPLSALASCSSATDDTNGAAPGSPAGGSGVGTAGAAGTAGGGGSTAGASGKAPVGGGAGIGSGGNGGGGEGPGGQAGSGGTAAAGVGGSAGSAGVGGTPGGGAGGIGLPACPTFAPPATAGLVSNVSITEASGVANSRKNPDVLWVHNDSGDTARVFAITKQGAPISVLTFAGATATDWEDIAVGPGPTANESYIYVGDIGDNGESRQNVKIYRVAEPTVTPGTTPATLAVNGVEQFTLKYPDGPHNAETLLVDPVNGDVYIVAKSTDGVSPVFRAAAPLTTASPITLEQVTTLTFGAAPLPGNTTTTGGDISPAGDLIAIRTYGAAFAWRRVAGATIADALATPPCPIPLAKEGQGEAFGFASDGGGYFTLSEGKLVPLSFYARN